MKTEFQKKKEAKQQAALELHKTKVRLGLGPTQPLRGATPSPLAATTWKRKVTLPPASDRIPGSAPARDLMHAHKWRRGAEETQATVKEICRKARQIAPAYNKGTLLGGNLRQFGSIRPNERFFALANSGVLPAAGWWDDHAFRHEVARAKTG